MRTATFASLVLLAALVPACRGRQAPPPEADPAEDIRGVVDLKETPKTAPRPIRVTPTSSLPPIQDPGEATAPDTSAQATEYVLKAADLQRKGHLDQAIAEMKKAEAFAPKDPDVKSALGRLLHQAGNAQEAKAAYTASLALDPSDDDAVFGLASLLVEGGDAAGARVHLQTLAARRPNDPRVQRLLGNAAEGSGDTKAAIDAWRKAAASDAPNKVEIQADLGNALAQSGQYGEAADTLSKAAAARPTDPVVQLQLGTALGKAGKLPEAEGALRRSAELAPTDTRTWKNLAVVREQMGDAKGAVEAYESLLRNSKGGDPGGDIRRRIEQIKTSGLAPAAGAAAAPPEPPKK